MHVMINIPEEEYNIIKNSKRPMYWAEHLIAKGTPIQKGHGDLIDKIELLKSLIDYIYGKKPLGQCIDDVQIIIKADKKESDE